MKRAMFILSLVAVSLPSFAAKKKGKVTEEQKQHLFDELKNKKFMWAYGEYNKIYTHSFRLSGSGIITGYDHENEKFWEINDSGQLVVLNAEKEVQWTFKRGEKDGKLYFEEPGSRYLLEM